MNTNIQKTNQVCFMWIVRLFPTKTVGQDHTTHRYSSEPNTAGKHDTKSISICVPQRTIWFQSHNDGAIGVCLPNPQNPDHRALWAPHSVNGWYPVTSTEQYHCYNVWIRETGYKIVSDTVYFKQKYITHPTVTPEDAVIKAARQLSVALKVKLKSAIDKSGINQLKKVDAFFITTAKNFRQQK